MGFITAQFSPIFGYSLSDPNVFPGAPSLEHLQALFFPQRE
jgi:hypothetical protein